MNDEDYLIEKFFLKLRTNKWISDIDEFKPALVPDFKTKIKNYQWQWFIEPILSSFTKGGGARREEDFQKENWFKLTDSWMDVFNSVITELLAKI